MTSSEWEGRVGEVWAEEWRRTDRSFVPVDTALVDAATERVGGNESIHIVDIGCGAGTTSFSLADRFPNALVTGVDLSHALIDVARSRLQAGSNVRFEQGDASAWRGATGVDLLVSRHGMMFFADPIGAFAHLRSLMSPGGAMVFSCFRSASLNRWASGLSHLMPNRTSNPHAPGPFAFADQQHVAHILAESGWRDSLPMPLDVDYVAGSGKNPEADALDYFRHIGPTARGLRELDDEGRARLEAGLVELIQKHCFDDRVSFPAAIWIWSATA